MVPLLEEKSVWQEVILDWVRGKVCVMQDLQGMWTSHKNSIQAPSRTDDWLQSSSHHNEQVKDKQANAHKKSRKLQQGLVSFPSSWASKTLQLQAVDIKEKNPKRLLLPNLGTVYLNSL